MKKDNPLSFLPLLISFSLAINFLAGCGLARIDIDSEITDPNSILLDMLMRETDFGPETQLDGIGILRQGKEVPIPNGLSVMDSASYWIRAEYKENDKFHVLLVGHRLYLCSNSTSCNIDNFRADLQSSSEGQFSADIDLPDREDAYISCVTYKSGKTKECATVVDYGNTISVLKFLFEADNDKALDILQNILNQIDMRIDYIS
jgi:hypothetical protein